MQYLIIARDGTDADALKRRLAVRQEHIEMGDQMRSQGTALFGAALLSESEEMNGSVYVVDFASRAELDEWLSREPYMTGDVWRDIEIIPCNVGPSFLQ